MTSDPENHRDAMRTMACFLRSEISHAISSKHMHPNDWEIEIRCYRDMLSAMELNAKIWQEKIDFCHEADHQAELARQAEPDTASIF